MDAGKDAYRVVRNAWDKKEKLSFASDEKAVEDEDVDVEFYYEPETGREATGHEGHQNHYEDDEHQGLLVKEEV